MAETQVFIIADSRGVLLKEQLDDVFVDIPFNLYWKKGLRLVDTYNYVAPIIRNFKPKLVYLLNGISDVTYLHSRNRLTSINRVVSRA